MRIETASVSKKTGSKFAVVVKDNDAKRSHVYSVPDEFTLNKTELLAIKFALLGINSEDEVVITTHSSYVSDMLAKEGDTWAKNPKSNAELITEIRELLANKNAKVICEKSEDAKSMCA